MKNLLSLIGLIFFILTCNVSILGYYKTSNIDYLAEYIDENSHTMNIYLNAGKSSSEYYQIVEQFKNSHKDDFLEEDARIENNVLYKKDQSFPYTGTANFYSSNNNLIGVYQFVNGKKEGKYIEYYDTKEIKIMEDGTYHSGKKIGQYKTYRLNGSTIEIGYHDSDKKLHSFNKYNERVETVVNINDNSDTISKTITYYEDSQDIKSIKMYINQQLKSYIEYFLDGNIHKSKSYNNGIPHGEHLIYHSSNKKIVAKTTFNNGIKEGVFI